jgi:hypothetical protein
MGLMIMLLPKGQKIRFFGSDRKTRAASLARELHGHCKVNGHEVELTRAAEFTPRLLDVQFPREAMPLRAVDFR